MSSSHENSGISRRQFLALTSGVAGMATLASMGIESDWKENPVTLDPTSIGNREFQSDVLVIGGGMAGLFAAVKAHDAGAKVIMASKGRLGSSGQTPFAKGIFAYDKSTSKMSIDEYVAKVSRSALGTNNPVYTQCH